MNRCSEFGELLIEGTTIDLKTEEDPAVPGGL